MTESNTPKTPRARNRKLMTVGLVLAAVLVVAGVFAFGVASKRAHETAATRPQTGAAVKVTIAGNTCDPNDISVPAGVTTFTIVNNTQRALEWEILDGVMVLEERENITPGMSVSMRAKLAPGTYDITCGLLSNPRGKLRVTPSAASDAEAAKPGLVQFVGPLAEYKVYLVMQTGALQDAVQQLSDAVAAGDLSQAQSAYLVAHGLYKSIEPAAGQFADLDTRLNARADYFERREADPAFAGFHRLEYALFDQRSLQSVAPVVQAIAADLQVLNDRLRALNLPPDRLAGAMGRVLQRDADNLPTGGEDRYSHAELTNLAATLEGTQKVADLLAPLLTKAAPAVAKELANAYADANAELQRLQASGANQQGVALTAAQRQQLQALLNRLTAAWAQVNAGLSM